MAFEAPTLEREEGADGEAAPKKAKEMSENDILSMLAAEKSTSIGFENGTELERKRKTALEYSKGVMSDVPSLANRSKAVSTDIAEAVETVMPDLMDIFTGGEDVAAFAPSSEEDEERAQQETDWVNYTAFRKLPGFLLLYTSIKDALQVDTGCLYTRWQDNEVTEDEEVFGKSAVELQMAVQDGGAELVGPAKASNPPMSPDGVPLFDAILRKSYDKGCIKSDAIDPTNLTVAQDATLDVNANVYQAIRAYPRAQALIDQGYDKNKVAELPAYSAKSDEQTDQARDVAGETTSTVNASEGSGPEGPDGKSLMRTVEVHTHFIRADIDLKGKSQLWQIETDSQCKVLLHKRKVDRTGLSCGTPFINAHRFYGMSLAEKLIEVQKIKTALLRLMLDSGYFAMNQRTEVAMDQANEHTISDLMRNEPMVPVRSKNGMAVRPLQAGQLGFDVGMALEYASTMGELRTGVVRNAQGLNPDTLHDTAKGAMALMTMAQKRVRMIARILAETLVKGWFLDLHALSRKHATRAEKIHLRGKWVDVNPSEFGDRSDMVIEVGVGAGGKEMELAALSKILEMQKEILINNGPVASWQNAYNALKRFCERAGFKAPELFFTDPAAIQAKKDEENAKRVAAGQPPIEEPPPPPSPDEVKAKAAMEIEQAKAQTQAQIKQMELAASEAKAARDYQLEVRKLEQEQILAREKLAAETMIARERLQLDGTLNDYKEQMAAQKLALENEWTKIEMQASEMRRQSDERQAELQARETALREQNDTAKIEADARKAELEAVNAERNFQLEQQRIALEERKLEMEQANMARQAMMPPVDTEASRGPAPTDRNGEAMSMAIMALAESMNRPKTATRPDGSKITIE